MAESVFDIFGTRMKNVTRQPLSNSENIAGKLVTATPIKPNEPLKKPLGLGSVKKSFFSNTGKAIQGTPARMPFSPRAVNFCNMIYTDDKDGIKSFDAEEMEFTKPSYKLDNFYYDVVDYMPLPQLQCRIEQSPPSTPPPQSNRLTMDYLTEREQLYMDDFSIDSLEEDDLGLPDIY